MKPRPCAVLVLLLLAAIIRPAAAQVPTLTPEVSREQATVARLVAESAVGAPSRVTLFDQATLRLEGALQFIDRDVAGRYLRAFGQPQPEGLAGVLLQGGREEPWYAVIRLVRDGFVDPTAIRRWTADDLLASARDDLKRENAERAARNQPARVIAGWRAPPRYDPETQSLVWSLASYVPGVSSQNETDSLTHLAVFGREGYFQVTIVTGSRATRDRLLDIGQIALNLRFLEGKTFQEFDPATDRVALNGLASVLGISHLRALGFMETLFEDENWVVFAMGGGLVVGAGLMAVAMAIARQRRNRRRV